MKKTRFSPLATVWSLAFFGAASRGLAAGLPTPCLPGTCGPNGPAGFVSSGTATAAASGNQLTVNQTSNQAILNWSNFNVAAGSSVVFQQPAATSIALNRIFQGSPSSILGSITANGQIYLINPNGLIFGSTASVNASSILASTLGISDSTFQSGLVSPAVINSQQPALASDGRTGVVDLNGNPVLGSDGKQLPVQLQVQGGAQLAAASGGRILLA
ncbi:MAG TPA: filamentous hemagglutinin N-terminal domain-containing protein, partial [Steroidobacteraceae bacterium]|nr:filamentous hemagglutinin N-terminal domain-containing protein [Steroidobacteraceae bacterium]